jgi:hypothetical protein
MRSSPSDIPYTMIPLRSCPFLPILGNPGSSALTLAQLRGQHALRVEVGNTLERAQQEVAGKADHEYATQ